MPTDTIADTLHELAADNLDDFLELEAKINRVAEALGKARSERDQALAALLPLQAAQQKLEHGLAQAERELVSLRKERHEIRQRVAKLVQQLEAAG